MAIFNSFLYVYQSAKNGDLMGFVANFFQVVAFTIYTIYTIYRGNESVGRSMAEPWVSNGSWYLFWNQLEIPRVSFAL